MECTYINIFPISNFSTYDQIPYKNKELNIIGIHEINNMKINS